MRLGQHFQTARKLDDPLMAKPRFIRDQRGTASIEAAVMLPILALCWAGLMLRFDQIESYLIAATAARRDAWIFSNAGCEDCPDGQTAKLHVEGAPGAGQGEFSWADTVRDIPVVGFFVDTIFGFQFDATGEQTFTEPSYFGAKSKTASYSYHLMCNEKSRDGLDVLKQVLVQTVDSLGLGFGLTEGAQAPNRDKACQ
jgi:Flp pilus assembly pilin Flp